MASPRLSNAPGYQRRSAGFVRHEFTYTPSFRHLKKLEALASCTSPARLVHITPLITAGHQSRALPLWRFQLRPTWSEGGV